MPTQKIYLQWNNDQLIWGDNPILKDHPIWSEVYILIEIGQALGGGGGGGVVLLPGTGTWKEVEKKLDDENIPEEKKRLFIQLIARVNGLVSSETKYNDSIKKKITVDHLKKTFESYGQKVEVTVKNIKKS